MSLPSISANRPSQVLPGLDIAKALAGGRAVADAPSGSRFGVSGADKGAGKDQINLSSQGRALQALDASGQDAETIKAETDILSKLTRQSLTYLVPDASSAKISFDHLSFSSSSNTSSSSSFQQSSNGTRISNTFHSDQQASLIGSGHITTADGREFEFQAELDISSSTDISQLSQSNQVNQSNQPGPRPAANGNTGFTGIGTNPDARFPPPPAAPTGPRLQDFIDASDRLLDLLKQTSPGQATANSQSGNPATDLIKDLLAQLQPTASTEQPEQRLTTQALPGLAKPEQATGSNNASTNKSIQSYQ